MDYFRAIQYLGKVAKDSGRENETENLRTAYEYLKKEWNEDFSDEKKRNLFISAIRVVFCFDYYPEKSKNSDWGGFDFELFATGIDNILFHRGYQPIFNRIAEVV